VVMWLVGTATVTTQGLTGSLRHDETKSGDFYLAKTGDSQMATSGDFLMATDSIIPSEEGVMTGVGNRQAGLPGSEGR
jgi:hypothetical protein